jgi:glycosyltransferase involved in cell wall biosynthesis
VAFYVPWIGPLLVNRRGHATGGAETQIFLLSRALARRGLRVCLLVFAIPDVEIPSSVHGVDVLVRPPYKAKQRVLGKVREIVNIRAALRSVDADAVVTRAAGPHVGLIRLFTRGRRFVYSSASPRDFDVVRVAPKRRDRLLLSFGLRMADEIVVQTEEQRQSCRDRLGRTPIVIRSLCELGEQGTGVPEAFLWVGRFHRVKRPLEYLELARAMPDAQFWMVVSSTAPTREDVALQHMVEAGARVLPNLRLFHALPRPELMDLVRRAAAVVTTSEYEGMSNVLLEGWAHGVPALVLAYDSDGIVARERVGLVAGGSRESFVEQARELWAGRFDRSELSSRCRVYVEEHHSPEHRADQWTDVLVRGLRPSVQETLEPEVASA